jgi:SAM-dependent methyltransferase
MEKLLMFDFDRELAERYGAFTSYHHTHAYPTHIEYHGEDPAAEVDRLLNQHATPESTVLDIGCGAGQTLCRLAPGVKQIWGIGLGEDLLQAARLRIERLGLTNAQVVHGNVNDPAAIKQLPEGVFNLAFSRRGPHFNEHLLPTLNTGAIFIQELVSDLDGYSLREVFGRKHSLNPYHASFPTNQQALLSNYARLGLVPVSCKEYFYEEYFRDGEHLAAFLTQVWAMLGTAYDPQHDQPALDLYVRYNTTSQGIRVLRQRKIFVLRLATTS